uniref:GRF-type domain-containing protein n=2 Tax=Triticum urartu TaxID=4572 RepID=A0A8R7UZ19_TRIUA
MMPRVLPDAPVSISSVLEAHSAQRKVGNKSRVPPATGGGDWPRRLAASISGGDWRCRPLAAAILLHPVSAVARFEGEASAGQLGRPSHREQPMDYEPTKFCSLCGRKAARWISGSPANPGRRYYSCVDNQHGFIEWHEGPTTPFIRDLLGDLRDKVWMRLLLLFSPMR